MINQSIKQSINQWNATPSRRHRQGLHHLPEPGDEVPIQSLWPILDTLRQKKHDCYVSCFWQKGFSYQGFLSLGMALKKI